MEKTEIYTPRPVDTSGVSLPAELRDLTERMARNVHEVWARGRLAEGWTLGEKRDDARKTHPCLVPYEALPEAEREYDRATAVETLKLILSLGFDIRKREGQEACPATGGQAEDTAGKGGER